MKQYGAFKFAPPKRFSDWTKYAGFDRTTGAVPGGAVAPAFGMMPVAPNEPNLQQKLANVGTAMQQVSQGNLSQAYNTMTNKPAVQPAAATPAATPVVQQPQPPSEDQFDYLSGLDR